MGSTPEARADDVHAAFSRRRAGAQDHGHLLTRRTPGDFVATVLVMVFRTLRGCTPFVACGVVSAFTEWRVGTVIALTLSLILLVANRVGGNGLGEAIFEASAALFCGVAVVVAFSVHTAPISAYIGTISVGWQALTAWGSLAIRRPFTLGGTGHEAPVVRRHVVIVAVWAAGFTVTAVVLALVEAFEPHSGVIEIVVQLAGNLVTAVLAHRYETRGEAPPPPGGAAPVVSR